MSLQDLKIKRVYRSIKDRLVEDFLAPALRRSTIYDRGTGFFSLSSLAMLADGLIPYIRMGGCIRIVTSVDLSPDDREIIQKGLNIQQESIICKLNSDVRNALTDEIDELKLDVITNLIAASRLIIKIAYMPCGGIYHEKIGLLKDIDGNRLCFIGSHNETYNGYNLNLESTVVLASWLGDTEDVDEQQNYFNKLWDNHVDGIAVFTFPDAVKRNLFAKYKKSTTLDDAIRNLEQAFSDQKTDANKEKSLYPYQEAAIEQFFKNGNNHFYEMATGTGKTFTAVKTVERLFHNTKILTALVLVPQVDLQVQWVEAFNEIGVSSVLFGGLANGSDTEYNFDNFIIGGYTSKLPVIGISTYDTFFSKLASNMMSLPPEKMIIIDEAHNLSPYQITHLPEIFPYRLGLSATPERFSASETAQIIEFFTRGTIETYKYTIEEAIENGFLSHYMYYPIFVHIDQDEFQLYQTYTKQLVCAKSEEPPDEEKIIDIMTKRSSVIKKASCKLSALQNMVLGRLNGVQYNFQNSVLYCGQGKDNSTEESIIDSVTRILAVDGHYSVSQFTSKTVDRIAVLSEFERGYYDVLAAIRCFDEGVDVPKLDKIYIMASDALSRQTIQRRGRVLRKCRETGKKMAYIYDFVVLPPEDVYSGLGVNSLVLNEIRRVTEYNRLADNQTINIEELDEICSLYGIELEGQNDGIEA